MMKVIRSLLQLFFAHVAKISAAIFGNVGKVWSALLGLWIGPIGRLV
jgi:hypothetical protein